MTVHEIPMGKSYFPAYYALKYYIHEHTATTEMIGRIMRGTNMGVASQKYLSRAMRDLCRLGYAEKYEAADPYTGELVDWYRLL